MANAFLESVLSKRQEEQREQERQREEEKAADRREQLAHRRELIAQAGRRVREVVLDRRAKGIPPPARKRGKRGPAKQPLGTAAPELHDVQVGDLPNFRLAADE